MEKSMLKNKRQILSKERFLGTGKHNIASSTACFWIKKQSHQWSHLKHINSQHFIYWAIKLKNTEDINFFICSEAYKSGELRVLH